MAGKGLHTFKLDADDPILISIIADEKRRKSIAEFVTSVASNTQRMPPEEGFEWFFHYVTGELTEYERNEDFLATDYNREQRLALDYILRMARAWQDQPN